MAKETTQHRLPIISKAQSGFCKDCKHFVLEDDIDGPGIPWCGNVATKTLNHPIGFLNKNAKACDLFETDQDQYFKTVSDGKLTFQRDKVASREHWSFTIVKVCLCLGFVKSLFTGQDEMAFKMALFLVVLSTLSLVKEVSADFIKGSLRVTR